MGNSNRKRPSTDSPGKICGFFGDFGAVVVGGAGNPNVEQCREFHKIRRSQGKAWYFYYAFASNKMCVCASLSSCFFIDMLCCLCMSFLHCRSCNLVFFWPPDCFMICVCSLCCFVLFVCCMEGTLSGSHLHFIPVTSRSHRITSLFPIHFAFQILPFLSIESLGNSDCKCNLKFTRINVAPLMGLLDAFRSSGRLLTFSCNPGIDETKSPKVGALLPSGKHAKSY